MKNTNNSSTNTTKPTRKNLIPQWQKRAALLQFLNKKKAEQEELMKQQQASEDSPAEIPTRDTTEEHLGKTTIAFFNSPKTEQTDEAETALRNINRRKGK
jgi:hypothetical protein